MMNEMELLNRNQDQASSEILRKRIRAKLGRKTIREYSLAEIRSLYDREYQENTARARSFFGDQSIEVR